MLTDLLVYKRKRRGSQSVTISAIYYEEMGGTGGIGKGRETGRGGHGTERNLL